MSIFKENKMVNLLGNSSNIIKKGSGILESKFIVPPFSVFDTKQGYWADRKRMWKKLGIKGELGRSSELLFNFCPSALEKLNISPKMNTSSIFDPVLCEVVYTWFNKKGGKIYDCFSGGSVRGIVAELLGYKYFGIDLSQEQIEANKENAKEIGVNPTWVCDDSINVDKYLEDDSVDMIFSCPPYFNLEVYSDKPNDLSNMSFDNFKVAYKDIITKACKKLKNDSFAVFVVGDIRDKDGYYINFVDYTKKCFNDNGLGTYNEIILLDMLGTAMIRCTKPFEVNKKVTKVHQNVLVFYKGNIKNIENKFK